MELGYFLERHTPKAFPEPISIQLIPIVDCRLAEFARPVGVKAFTLRHNEILHVSITNGN